MKKPKAVVIYGDGINCDAETSYGLELAGFDAHRQHVTDLLASPRSIFDDQLVVIPGGFSFGDEIASGKILAVKIKNKLQDTLYDYIGRGGLVLGICNGFQVLVQLGLLPNSGRDAQPTVSLARNSGGKFINKWASMKVPRENPCPFFDSLEEIELPIRHGEGRLVVASDKGSENENQVRRQATLAYTEDVNGSFERIAGLSNESGNVCGLMPHPEAFVRWTQHPAWTSRVNKQSDTSPIPHGLAILSNAAKAVK